MHINFNAMDEDYPIPDMEKIIHKLHGASYFGKNDPSDAYYQIELDEEANDIGTIKTSQVLFKLCRLRQGLKNSSSVFQNSIKSTLKGIKGVAIFQDNALVHSTAKEQFDKRMLAVQSRLREKNYTFNKKKFNSKPVDLISFLGYSISKQGIAPDSKHVEKIKNAKAPTNNKQLESFVGLAKFYGKMIPNFVTKMLPLNNMRNTNFSWSKMQQKTFEDIEIELCADPLVQPYSLQKEATITTGGVFSQEGYPIIYVSRTLTSAEQILFKARAESTSNCVCGHKIEAIPSGKTIYPKRLKNLLAPCEDIPKTALTRKTRWAVAL